MILFDNFTIIGADGITYQGQRPGLIPKPFRFVEVVCKNGKKLLPCHSDTKSEQDILGFDASIKVIADAMNASNQSHFYRLMCLYNDNSCFSVFFDLEGNAVGQEWD